MDPRAKKILNEFDSLSTETDAMRKVGYENLFQEVYSSVQGGSQRRELIDTSYSVSARLSIARQICSAVLAKHHNFNVQVKTEVTQTQTIQNIKDILNNPQAYGVKEEELDEILESAYLIHDADDRLDSSAAASGVIGFKTRESRAEMEAKYAEKARGLQGERIDAASGKIGAIWDELEDEELRKDFNASPEEIREERKKQTLKVLNEREEALRKKRRVGKATNSKGELLELELTINSLHLNGAKRADDGTAPLLTSIAGSAAGVRNIINSGEGSSLYKNAAGFLASSLAKKFVTQTVMKLGIQAALTGLTGGAALLASGAVSLAVDKVIAPVMKNWKELLALAMAVPLAIAGIFIAAIGAVAAAFGITVVAVVIGVPIITVLILFIINSGAYIVPPSTPLEGVEIIGDPNSSGVGGGVKENPYIFVSKIANPAGPFPNQFPKSIQYTITIRAKQSANPLTNVKLKYECSATAAAGNVACPPNPTLPTPPATIDAAGGFSFSYTQNYSAAFRDSLVMDTITVTADVAGTVGSVASGFASVIFGTPPTGCFTLNETWGEKKPIMLQAIAQIVRQKDYTAKLCAKGTIPLIYDSNQANGTTPGGIKYGGYTTYPRITFYPLALGNVNSAFYTLAHESGHIFSHAQPGIYDNYKNQVPLPTTDDGFICTYPIKRRTPTFDPRLSENFAEAIALYHANNSLSSATRDFTCMGGLKLQQKYPTYYNFLNANVF